MTETTRKETPNQPGHNHSAAAAPATKEKKVYRKPALSKYDQLHGIGLGS